MRQKQHIRGPARKVARTLVLGASVASLGACDSLLEVELPHILTEAAIGEAPSAPLQVNSIQALFECGMSAFSWVAMGHEDIFESVAGVAGTVHVYRTDPVTGPCDQTAALAASTGAQNWFDQIMATRQMVSTDPAKLGNYGGSNPIPGVYDQLADNGWSALQVGGTAVGERLMAITSIYMGASLAHFGQYYCEGALDVSQMITGPQFLALAEDWLTNRALVHIGNTAAFAMPNASTTGTGATPTIVVRALRAQVRLAAGDLAGANTDALAVLTASPTFAFNITRESGTQRRNKVFAAGTSGSPFSGMIGISTNWGGPSRAPNPATGQTWPDIIPFTGYIFLGIQPNGLTLENDNTPMRWAQEARGPAPTNTPISLGNGASADPRTPHIFKSIQGPAPREVANRFTSNEADLPFATWREMTLIRARFENEVNNDQVAAINLLNGATATSGTRLGAAGCTPVSATCIPNISGTLLTALTNGVDDASLVGANDQAEMRMIILEEARREFFGGESGRWWQWKIQNTDLMWFPRFQGYTQSGVYRLQGGVRLNWPIDEYDRNPAFQPGGRTLRGSGCTAATWDLPADISERPVNN